MARRGALFLCLCLGGCGARSGLLEPSANADATPTCAGLAPVCVRASDDPCGAPGVVPALCDGTRWRCPSNARPYARVDEGEVCSPSPEGGGTIHGSLARVPSSDGRCLWIADSLREPGGRVTRNAAFEAPREAGFGVCPRTLRRATGVAAEAVRVEGGDARDVAQVTGGFWLNGAWLTYRLFRADGGAHFGLSLVGTGLARWSAGGVELPRATDARFAPMDLGDASLVWREHAYVYGCPGPIEFLTERCMLARFDVDEHGEIFVGGANPWAPLSAGNRGATVFDAGPWISSVVEGSPGVFHAITAVGFAREVRVRRARAPEGPWSDNVVLARCALPGADPAAYCAGPVAHMELSDPTRPGEVWLSYGIGTTAPGRARDEDYATRLVRVSLPR